jgi:hypothetical protein
MSEKIRVEFNIHGEMSALDFIASLWSNSDESTINSSIGYEGSDTYEKNNHNFISDDEIWISIDADDFVPQQFLEHLHEFLNNNHGKVTFTFGKYWNEDYSMIGVFYINEGGWEFEEQYTDWDMESWEEENPDGFFHDDVVIREFEEMEFQLGQP